MRDERPGLDSLCNCAVFVLLAVRRTAIILIQCQSLDTPPAPGHPQRRHARAAASSREQQHRV